VSQRSGSFFFPRWRGPQLGYGFCKGGRSFIFPAGEGLNSVMDFAKEGGASFFPLARASTRLWILQREQKRGTSGQHGLTRKPTQGGFYVVPSFCFRAKSSTGRPTAARKNEVSTDVRNPAPGARLPRGKMKRTATCDNTDRVVISGIYPTIRANGRFKRPMSFLRL
jgi:hypothetical protein